MSELKEKVIECKQCLNPRLTGIHTCDIYNKQQEELRKKLEHYSLSKTEDNGYLTFSYPWYQTPWWNYPSYSRPACPRCGYCPHCGRGNDYYGPYITW